jgi:hypothetical protein
MNCKRIAGNRSQYKRLLVGWSIIGLAIIGGANDALANVIYEVDLNTTGLQGTAQLPALDLVAGDTQAGNNQVTASNFQTDGTLANSSDVSLRDVSFFNEELRTITLGKSLKFDLSLTANDAPPGVDEFSFLVLDPVTHLPSVHSTDPTGSDVLFAIDIDGSSAGAVSVYGSLSDNVSWTVTERAVGVPDAGPAAVTFSMTILAMFSAAWKRGKKPLPQSAVWLRQGQGR